MLVALLCSGSLSPLVPASHLFCRRSRSWIQEFPSCSTVAPPTVAARSPFCQSFLQLFGIFSLPVVEPSVPPNRPCSPPYMCTRRRAPLWERRCWGGWRSRRWWSWRWARRRPWWRRWATRWTGEAGLLLLPHKRHARGHQACQGGIEMLDGDSYIASSEKNLRIFSKMCELGIWLNNKTTNLKSAGNWKGRSWGGSEEKSP